MEYRVAKEALCEGLIPVGAVKEAQPNDALVGRPRCNGESNDGENDKDNRRGATGCAQGSSPVPRQGSDTTGNPGLGAGTQTSGSGTPLCQGAGSSAGFGSVFRVRLAGCSVGFAGPGSG
jgi:hypothetical protein